MENIQTDYYLDILFDALEDVGLIHNRHHLTYHQVEALKGFIRDVAQVEFDFGYNDGLRDAPFMETL